MGGPGAWVLSLAGEREWGSVVSSQPLLRPTRCSAWHGGGEGVTRRPPVIVGLLGRVCRSLSIREVRLCSQVGGTVRQGYPGTSQPGWAPRVAPPRLALRAPSLDHPWPLPPPSTSWPSLPRSLFAPHCRACACRVLWPAAFPQRTMRTKTVQMSFFFFFLGRW